MKGELFGSLVWGREGCVLDEEKKIWKGKLLLTFSYVFVCLCFEGSVLANARQASSHPWSYISFVYEICKHAHHFSPSREVRATFSFASMYWFIYVPQALRHILVYPEVSFSDFYFQTKNSNCTVRRMRHVSGGTTVQSVTWPKCAKHAGQISRIAEVSKASFALNDVKSTGNRADLFLNLGQVLSNSCDRESSSLFLGSI